MPLKLKSSKLFTIFFLVLLTQLTNFSVAQAHNKVVVIPLLGETQNLNNIVTVAKDGGQFTDIQQAIDSIEDAGRDNRYVLFIAPGVYTITKTIVVGPYIRIVGSGKGTTVIKGQIVNRHNNSNCFSSKVMLDFDTATAISDLSLELNGKSGDILMGICTSSGELEIRDINLVVQNGTMMYGIGSHSSILNTDIRIFGNTSNAKATGILSDLIAHLSFKNSTMNINTATSSIGINVFGDSTAEIVGSEISTQQRSESPDGVKTENGGQTVVAHSKIVGNVHTNNIDGGALLKPTKVQVFRSSVFGSFSGLGSKNCLYVDNGTAELSNSCD